MTTATIAAELRTCDTYAWQGIVRTIANTWHDKLNGLVEITFTDGCQIVVPAAQRIR